MTDDRRELTTTPMDAALQAMFDRRADRADAVGLRGQVLSATVVAPQVRRWRLRLPFDVPQALPRALVLVLLAAALVAIGLLGVGVLGPQPAPTGFATQFIRPFEYTAPAEAELRQTVVRRELVAWSAGPRIPSTLEPDAALPLAPNPWDARGIYVASVGAHAWSHSPTGRFALSTAPAAFLADLRDRAGVHIGDVVPATLDGRPALSVMLPGTAGSDLHLFGGAGVGSDFVFVNMPGRLLVADIDGATVFVLVWARSADDLAAWLPIADRLRSSIHFERADRR